MILRPTKIEDISRVIDIINQAKTYFKKIMILINGKMDILMKKQLKKI